MTKKTINIGSGELSGDGESLRSAFSKTNENFDELYSTKADKTEIPTSLSELTNDLSDLDRLDAGENIPSLEQAYTDQSAVVDSLLNAGDYGVDLSPPSNYTFYDLVVAKRAINPLIPQELEQAALLQLNAYNAWQAEIAADKATITVGDYAWEFKGDGTVDGLNVDGDITGSVFADDSTLLVDGVNSSINLDGTVKGNVIPDADNAYDLGSADKQFRSLYVSSNTIFVDGTALGVADGKIQIEEDGAQVDVASRNYVDEQVSQAVIDANGVDLFGYVQTGDNISGLTNDSNFATETYVDTAEADAIATAASDATTKADQAEADANTYTDTRETAITTAYQTYADQAEADANTYTDTRETAITTAYELYADQAETDAVATAAADATTKADAAETAANAYTDTREAAITTAYQTYADTAETDAVTTANAYTDTRETAITTAYQTYADQAEADANTYTDTRETAITTAYESYADQAELDAVATAAADATTKADAAETAANTYTDTRETAITTAYQLYADTAETDAVTTANAYTDTRETAITSAYQTYADQAETDAVTTANTYTDTREAAITTAYRTYADDAQADAQSYADGVVGAAVTTLQGSISSAESDAIDAAQTYTDAQINNLVGTSPATLDTIEEIAQALGDDPNAVGTITTALANRVRTDVDNQGLNAGDQLNARINIGLGTAATQNTGAFATAAQGVLADSAVQPGDNVSDLVNDENFASATYVDQAEADAIATAATDATTKADAAETAANTYTDTRETAITTAYQAYADQAEADAVATAAADATTKADAAEAAANSYTDTRETAITTAYQAYADQAEADAIATAAADATTKADAANTYTDTRETAITTAYQAYADQAEADAVTTANAYTDTRETAITTAYQLYADTAETDAVTTAASDATTKADAAETAANAYTDTRETAITTAYQLYADTAETDAVTTANAYTDTRETAITTAYQLYANTAETDAVTTANAYTDTRETAITTAYQLYANTAEADAVITAQTYTDAQINSLVGTSPATLDTIEELAQALGDDPNAVGTITTALANRVRTDVDNQGLSVGGQLNARINIGLGTAATQDTDAFATAAQGATADNALPAASVSEFGETLIDDLDAATARTTLGLGTAATTASTDYATATQGATADTALQPGNNISELVNDEGYIRNADIGSFASEAYVDQAELDAIATSEAYTDTRETAITTAYQAYADQAETDAVTAANAYTDNIDLFDLGIVDALPGQILATDGAGVAAFASPDTFGGNRVYVSAAKGNDANDGINQPVASIKKALQIASGMVYNGDSDVVDAVTVMIASGEYTLDNPVIIPDSVSIVGDNLRRVIIRPQNANKDMFRVRNNTYITNVTFRDTADLTSTFRYAISFDNVNDADTSRVGYTNLPTAKPTITTSPYVQNCSVISFLGANGVEIDGDLIISPNVPADAAEAERPQVGDVPEYGKSMVGNAFTILSFGGTAWRVINDAYAQIVSCFVIFTEQGCLTQNGGYLSITNSATNFGLYALRSTGYSPNSFTFNRGYISGNGIADSTQTLRAVGLGQGAIEQYVLRFRNSSDVDITDNFNSNGSLGISADWVASTDSVSGSSVTFATAHGFSTGDVVEYNSNDNVEIVGLLNEVTYYITANNLNTITLYHDEARTRPVRFLDASVTSGTHTFKTGYEEFFVQEVLDTHNIYQDIVLAAGTYNPVIGDTIIGTDGADTITAIISAWDSGARKLTVSIELTGEQRNKFSPSATINAGELAAGAVDIDGVTDRADLFTSNFKVFSTLDRTVQNIGSLNSNQVWLHRPSILNSSAHTWEYAGSGTDYNALPQNGGETDASYEQASTLPGRVYASGTNELGDFKIGDFVTAENRTGNISFKNTVTISQLDNITLSASPDNIITQISTDNGLGDNELGGATHNRLSTQKAVKDFVVGNVGNFFEKEISTNARPNAVVQLNAQGRLNTSVVPTTSGFTSYTVNEQDGRLTLHLDIPAKDLNAGNIIVEQYTDNGNDITDTYFLANDNTSQFLIYTDINADFADAIANTTNITGAVSGATVTATSNVKGVLTAIDANSIAGSGYLTDGTFVGVEIVSNTGTGALADITIASGNVTGIDLTRGGSGFADGDTIAATPGTGTPALPNRSGGVELSATVTDVENRLFVNIDQNVGIAFNASNDEPDFVADDNASTVVIADLEDTSVKAFDSTSDLATGDVDYTNSQINIPTHGLLSGDIVQYSVNGGTNIGGLTDANYYYIKSIDADTIELYTNYNLDAKVTFTTQGNGTQNLTRVTVGLNTLRKTSHGLTTGQPVRVTGSDVPQGITSGDFAYVGSVTTNTFTLHTNRGDAVNSTGGTTVNEIAFADSGTGSLTLTDQNISIVSQVNTSGSDVDSWGSLNTNTIDASNIISGIIDADRLGSGTANDKTFLRGDSSYANAVQGITSSEGITLTGTDTTTDGPDTVYFNRVDLSVETATSPSAGAETKGIASFEFTDFDVTDGKVTIKDDSHNHIISNIDGLSTALSDAESNAVSTANTYTDGRETAITTAYQTYADTAETDAVTTANAYTDTRETAITTAYQTYADTAETDAVTTANAYTDTRETAITTAYESYADTAETDAVTTANAYTDGRETAITTAYQTYTDTAVANIVDTAPETLDTLNELAAALGDDPNFATTVSNSIGTKLNSSAVSAFGLTLIDDADAATARTTLGLGTAATTASTDYATAAQGALADSALQSVAFGDLTSTPTTLSGYGITDAATSAQGALADSALQSVAFGDLTSTPTTLSGYGITDSVVLSDANIEQQPVRQYYANQSSFPSATAWHGAIAHSHSDAAMYFAHGGVWNKLANNSDIPTNNNQLTNGAGYLTSVAFGDLTSTPTTLSGYGITDAQPLDADLTAIAGLSSADGNFIVGSATGWVAESGATARTSLGLGSLATLSAVGASEITDNSVGAAELNVSGDGTSGQALVSDGDGTFSWTTISSDVVSDTTPQLGGNLDGQNYNITDVNVTANTLKIDAGTQEAFSTLTNSIGTVTHNCANGHIFYHTTPSTNWTANFTNLTLTAEYATALTIVINQGSFAYIPTAVQIGGVAHTINWAGNVQPTGTANGIDVVSFSILNDGGTELILGQLSTFGG